MTPIALVDELVKFLKITVKDFDMDTKVEGVTKIPSIYAGYLPQKNDDNKEGIPEDHPYVIVRYINESDDANEDNEVSINLIIATHSEDEQNGWRDTLNITTRIKIALKKAGFIGAFSLGDKIKTDLLEDQPYPYWFAVMDMTFKIPQVKQEIDWSEMD